VRAPAAAHALDPSTGTVGVTGWLLCLDSSEGVISRNCLAAGRSLLAR